MHAQTLSHFNRVAQAMNKYVAISGHNARVAARQRLKMGAYQPWYRQRASLNRFPGGFYPMGMGNNYFNNGYQLF